MFRDRLLSFSFIVSFLINTFAVGVVGGVTNHPWIPGAEAPKKIILRPVRIGSYKPPKAPKVRVTLQPQSAANRVAKANKQQAKTSPRKAAQARLAKNNKA